ncbi:MAG: ECF transporter S component [Candidatus Faecousia sp.]|nr:ECF transporter S component [Candidatus Faecousia sp.]
MKNKNISRMVQLAILLAVVVVLQCFLGSIRVGATSFSVVLVPIVVGAIILGPAAGAFLGFAFGLVVLIYGITGQDAFTNLLFQAHPVFTSIICLGKGAAAGWGAGMLYKLLEKISPFLASVAAAASAPVLNTGLFILGGLTLVRGTLEANLAAFGADSVVVFLVIGCAGVNFLVEFLVNLVISPAIHRIVTVVKHKFVH